MNFRRYRKSFLIRLTDSVMTGNRYNFDELVNRKGTGSMKWDNLKKQFGSDDLLPLWVADMDFRVPQPVTDAMVSRAKHGIFGYTRIKDSYFDSIINWYAQRYNWKLKKEWFVFAPGVVPAIILAIRAFTRPGDGIIVQSPVYYPFYESVELNGRHIVNNPLKLVNGRYEMDFEDLEKKAGDTRVRMMILCNPHNPVGRVWSKDDLTRLGEICNEHGIIVIADEIHSDLRFPGISFTNYASISEEFAQKSITCTAASKTFKLAGLQISNIIIPNVMLRQKYENILDSSKNLRPNSFAADAVEAAYNHGGDWLQELMEYLKGNLEFLKNFIHEKIPEVEVIEPQGTYLVWLDFRKVEPNPGKLEKLMRRDAKVALDEGYIFRNGGEGFERINIACPRPILEQALGQIAEAVRRYRPKTQ